VQRPLAEGDAYKQSNRPTPVSSLGIKKRPKTAIREITQRSQQREDSDNCNFCDCRLPLLLVASIRKALHDFERDPLVVFAFNIDAIERNNSFRSRSCAYLNLIRKRKEIALLGVEALSFDLDEQRA